MIFILLAVLATSTCQVCSMTLTMHPRRTHASPRPPNPPFLALPLFIALMCCCTAQQRTYQIDGLLLPLDVTTPMLLCR